MKRRYRVLLVLISSALAVAAIVAAGYRIENVRGANTWEQTRRELAVQGESLDPANFIPPAVPDDQNLALIPVFARALDYRVEPKTKGLTLGAKLSDDSLLRDMPYGRDGKKPKSLPFGGWESGHALSMEAAQQFYAQRSDFPHPVQTGTPADDVLLALTKFAPVFDEIEEAIPVRPRSRFPVHWTHWPPTTLALPHDNLIQLLTSTLRLRASARLESGRHVEAARDLATAFRLRAAIQPEPTLIAHLAVATCDNILLQTVWEGLANRQWTADELRGIQEELRADDLLADYVHAIRSERALFFCRMMDPLRQGGSMRDLFNMADSANGSSTGVTANWWLDVYPRGWIAENEAAVCLGYQRLITEAVDLKARRVAPGRVPTVEKFRATATGTALTKTFMAGLMLPVCGSVLEKVTRAQAACDEAETACALGRYFLLHGVYPESLEALVPALLDRVPTDLIDGAPLRYRRTDDGRYLLYEVGWNERDDGGVVAWPKSASNPELTRLDGKEGD